MTIDEPTTYRTAFASDFVDRAGNARKARDDDSDDDDSSGDDDDSDDDDPSGGTGGGQSGGGNDGGGHSEFADPLFFAENTPKLRSPETPGRLDPDKRFEMKFVNRKRDMPDGREVEFWSFEDRLQDHDEKVVVPGSLIRVNEGDIVHVTVYPSKSQHTIHMHGIEADTFNDGVGHTSFEVTDSYTYQFRAGAPFRALDDPRPQTRGAGTYMYHCHVNTTLHFQLGMWGAIIIDPASGPGTAFHGGQAYSVGAERVWACGDVDPVWHDELGHAAGISGGDAGLNDFNPVYFHLSGVFQEMSNGSTDPTAVITDDSVAIETELGRAPALVRYLNSSYTRQRVTFHGVADGSLDIDVIAGDGRPYDNVAPNFARPFGLTRPMEMTTGERYDYLITPRRRGTSLVTIENMHWISGKVLGVVQTAITVV